MRIKFLTARPILDSRGQWTVETTIQFKNGSRTVASVPQGKSTGSAEARALPAVAAARNINNVIAPQFKRIDPRDQKTLDGFLVALDGTSSKSKLGANAILAVSIAFARASAEAKNIPLWRQIRADAGLTVGKRNHPRLFMNVVNGGLHAGNNLDFQEYLIIPKCNTIRESVDVGVQVYHALGETLARSHGKQATNLGDEGGYAPDFKDDTEPFRILHSVVKKLKLTGKIDFGMDAAATDIKKVDHKNLENIYVTLLNRYGLVYLEDPFGEEDFLSFAALNMRFGKCAWITGDDLTTTNVRRMERAHAEGSVNAVIIKPNQIGSVSEALDAVCAAKKYGWKVIVSHRSGETNDDFIADFAYGVGADGIKLGAPARGERVAKYNRLLQIEKEEI